MIVRAILTAFECMFNLAFATIYKTFNVLHSAFLHKYTNWQYYQHLYILSFEKMQSQYIE